MSNDPVSARRWIGALVAAHLGVALIHGIAHGQARVPLSPPADLFVFVVIIAGPLAGVALSWRNERAGSWLVALTLAGSLLFGIVNHFVLAGPDHVAHVAPGWQPLFAITAALLALTETLGAGLAVRVALGRTERP